MINKNGKFLLSQWSNTENTSRYKNVAGSAAICVTVPYFKDNSRVYCGTGTTQPRDDEYTLDERLTGTYLKLVAQGHSVPTQYEDGYILTTTSTWLNVSNEPVTVRELGLVCAQPNTQGQDMGVNTDYFSFNGVAVMVARQLIEPVTLQPGETYAFTMVLGND